MFSLVAKNAQRLALAIACGDKLPAIIKKMRENWLGIVIILKKFRVIKHETYKLIFFTKYLMQSYSSYQK